MTYAHLGKMYAVGGAFNAVIILSAAQPVPHGFDGGIDFGGCPIGIAVVGNHTAQVLEGFIFIFDGCLQPVFAVQVHHNAALVKAALAFKLGFYGEGEKLLVGGHLQHGSIVVSEMIIRALLEICVGFGGDFDSFIRDRKICGLTRPFQCIDIKVHFL